MPESVLVVDDEISMRRAMEGVLRRCGYEVDTAADGRAATQALSRRDYGVVVTDLRMPGMDGRELISRVRAIAPSAGVVVVTAYGTVSSAVGCVRDGAVDYLEKPFSPEALERAVAAAARRRGAGDDDDPGGFVFEDPASLAALELASRAAATEATVLFEGESGTGKEVFARLLHRKSARGSGPFVAVNCAALPRELLEAELFGHRRGAFTGADRDRRGRFELADGGTHFLDEIGEMPAELQAKLLRVLQDRSFHPVGSETPVRVSVRVAAATHRELRDEVAAGRFREDLYYRLRVLPIRIPPLRERPADLDPLARRFAARYGGPGTTLSDGAMARLRAHSWPGNVRELQNAIQRAAILAGGGTLEADHFALDAPPAPRPGSADGPRATLSLDDAEREAIARTLRATGGRRSEAAAALGISPRTLRHKLKRYRDLGVPVVEAVR